MYSYPTKLYYFSFEFVYEDSGFDYYLTANEILLSCCPSVPSSPQSFSLSPVAGSPTQLSASWSVPIPRNGIITGYSVYCNTSANQAYPEQMIGPNVPTIRSAVNGTTLATTLTGLNPYTQYSCYVTANTSVGQGSPSTTLTQRTVETGELSIAFQYLYSIYVLAFQPHLLHTTSLHTMPAPLQSH